MFNLLDLDEALGKNRKFRKELKKKRKTFRFSKKEMAEYLGIEFEEYARCEKGYIPYFRNYYIRMKELLNMETM